MFVCRHGRSQGRVLLAVATCAVIATFFMPAIAAAQEGNAAKFLNLRYNEDFSGEHASDRSDWLKNIDLMEGWKLDIGGEFRLRVEARDNAAFTGPQNTQQFYRWLLHTDIKYGDQFRVFVQGIVAHAEDQDTGFNFMHENHGDLQQLFFDLRLGEGSPWYVRIGRQELLYGNERYVSPFEWASTRRRFDAAKLVYEGELWNIEGFYAKPVVVARHDGDDYNEEFDFAGLYATYSGIENHGLDLYFFAIDRTQDTVNPNGNVGDQSIFTLGARLWGKHGQWDMESELAGQWGTWAGDSVQAWSVALDAGYTWDVACSPRLGVGFDWATGDDSPTDGNVETFNQMFPLGHKYFGYMDLIGRQNIAAANVNLSAWIIPKKVKTRLAYHTFWLSEDEDALYNAGGAPVLRDATGSSGNDIGSEIDLTVKWGINNHSSLLLGYSHFFNDNFISATVAGDDDPDLFYVQYQYKF